ncbi:DUF6675 family protein [Treponema sp.]|uniref:DUF6675 family protein n=1 Tax=Treponema sp. TaxID=166 RepID=UPI003EFD79F7
MKFSAVFLAGLLIFSSAVSAFPFNEKLSGQELESALNGNVLIRNISSYKNICLDIDNDEVNECLQELRELNPRYFVEVLQIRKVKPDDRIIEKLSSILLNVDSYTKIPYYSERYGTTTPLYSYCSVLSRLNSGGLYSFTADMTMPPFEMYTAEISIKTDYENFLLYKSRNLNDMNCISFVRVKENCLRSVIFAFRDGDSWIIYGVGAAKAPKLKIFTSRIETAFISRVKAFCSYATSFLDAD